MQITLEKIYQIIGMQTLKIAMLEEELAVLKNSTKPEVSGDIEIENPSSTD